MVMTAGDLRKVQTFDDAFYRGLVERGGARFIGIVGDSVRFADPRDGAVMSLFLFALRSTEDVRLALKSHRESLREFAPLQPTDDLRF